MYRNWQEQGEGRIFKLNMTISAYFTKQMQFSGWWPYIFQGGGVLNFSMQTVLHFYIYLCLCSLSEFSHCTGGLFTDKSDKFNELPCIFFILPLWFDFFIQANAKVKQVRNLCIYSRPGDRVWLQGCQASYWLS